MCSNVTLWGNLIGQDASVLLVPFGSLKWQLEEEW